jgi:hypothetical protein
MHNNNNILRMAAALSVLRLLSGRMQPAGDEGPQFLLKVPIFIGPGAGVYLTVGKTKASFLSLILFLFRIKKLIYEIIIPKTFIVD